MYLRIGYSKYHEQRNYFRTNIVKGYWSKTYRRRKVDSKYTRHITEGGKYKSTTLLL